MTDLQIRIAKTGMRQWEFAKMIGKGDPWLSKTVRDARKVTDADKKLLADALGVSIKTLWPASKEKQNGIM